MTKGDPVIAIKRTWYNRLRFWLFFNFFPFAFKAWIEKERVKQGKIREEINE